MRKGILFLGAAAAFAFAGSAQALVLVEGTELPSYISVSNQLATSHGVTFASNMPFVTFGVNGVSTVGIYGTESWANPLAGYGWYASPIELTFVDMGDGVTPATVSGTINAVFGDGGGDTDGIRLRAYDINNVLIGTNTALTVSFGPISFSGTGIHRIVFDQSGLGSPTSDTFLDWVSYPEPVGVPEPVSALCFGAAALVLSTRRRTSNLAKP